MSNILPLQQWRVSDQTVFRFLLALLIPAIFHYKWLIILYIERNSRKNGFYWISLNTWRAEPQSLMTACLYSLRVSEISSSTSSIIIIIIFLLLALTLPCYLDIVDTFLDLLQSLSLFVTVWHSWNNYSV